MLSTAGSLFIPPAESVPVVQNPCDPMRRGGSTCSTIEPWIPPTPIPCEDEAGIPCTPQPTYEAKPPKSTITPSPPQSADKPIPTPHGPVSSPDSWCGLGLGLTGLVIGAAALKANYSRN